MAHKILLVFGIACYAGPLLLAALSDIRSFKIPNGWVFLLAGAYPDIALLTGQMGAIPMHVVVGGGMLLAGGVLFAVRALGGGDAKLLAAAALWIGPAGMVSFMVLTSLIGGAFALGLLVLRRVRGEANGPIPYGVPIAIAGLLMAPALFSTVV